MPEVPFPVSGLTLEEIKQQVNELFRTIFEDRIGGYERTALDTSTLLSTNTGKDVVTSDEVSPTFAGVTLTDLTASRLVRTNADKELASTNLHTWVNGTTGQIAVTDDGDGTITLSHPIDMLLTDLEGLIFYAGKR